MKYFIIIIGIIIIIRPVIAQPAVEIDSADFDALMKRIEKLENDFRRQKEGNELEDLLNEADQLAVQEKEEEVDISKKFHTGIRQQQGLNPNISIGGDFFGAVSTSKSDIITAPSEFTYGNNGMHLREIEASFMSALDPFARGKVFLQLNEYGLEVEEAYMELLNLPLKASIKAGKIFAEYGLLNRYHEHALPQFDRPRVATHYFGKDNFGGIGLAGNFMLPNLFFADATTLDITVVEGGNEFSFTDKRKMNFFYLGHIKNYYDLSESSYFEYTISCVTGRNDTTGYTNSTISSLGLHYKWEPPSRSKYRTFDWKTELYYGFMEDKEGNIRSKGFYTSFQNKLNARFWIGGRIGYAELPYDNNQSEWDYTVCLDYWQSEFVFFRLQYQYNDRNIHNMLDRYGHYPSDHSIVLEISWAMGPHKHEAY